MIHLLCPAMAQSYSVVLLVLTICCAGFRGEVGMNIRIVMFAWACVALSGCAQNQAAQQAEAAANAEEQAQVQRRKDDAQCRSNGFEPGSPDYAQCRTNLDNQHGAAQQPQQQNPFTGAHLYHR
jgi:hypothetical protein